MNAYVGRFHYAERRGKHIFEEFLHGVIVRGCTRLLHFIRQEPRVTVLSVPLEEERYATPLDTPTLKKAARHLRGAGRRHGITKQAKKLLRGL